MAVPLLLAIVSRSLPVQSHKWLMLTSFPRHQLMLMDQAASSACRQPSHAAPAPRRHTEEARTRDGSHSLTALTTLQHPRRKGKHPRLRAWTHRLVNTSCTRTSRPLVATPAAASWQVEAWKMRAWVLLARRRCLVVVPMQRPKPWVVSCCPPCCQAPRQHSFPSSRALSAWGHWRTTACTLLVPARRCCPRGAAQLAPRRPRP